MPGIQPLLSGPATGRILRGFALPAADGRTVRLSDFRQRSNLVVLLHHGSACHSCRDIVAGLARQNAAFAEAEADVLAIGPDQAPAALPGVVALSDPGCVVAAQEQLEVPAVIVTDRFAEVWALWTAGAEHALPSPDELVEWVRFVALQCRECEASEWPAADAQSS